MALPRGTEAAGRQALRRKVQKYTAYYDTAEDIVQETLLAYWRHFGILPQDAKLTQEQVRNLIQLFSKNNSGAEIGVGVEVPIGGGRCGGGGANDCLNECPNCNPTTEIRSAECCLWDVGCFLNPFQPNGQTNICKRRKYLRPAIAEIDGREAPVVVICWGPAFDCNQNGPCCNP